MKQAGFTPTPNFRLSVVNRIKFVSALLFGRFDNARNKRELGSRSETWCRGFTLIELLVVIAIIGVLASVLLASISEAQASARDTARMQLLKQIEIALFSFHNDNGHYPEIIHGIGVETELCAVGVPGSPENWGHCDRLKILTDLLAPYITIAPEELSSFTQGDYFFSYNASPEDNWQSFGIMFFLENNEPNDGGIYPNGYELGEQPTYCARKYTGIDREWLSKGEGYWQFVCRGGN